MEEKNYGWLFIVLIVVSIWFWRDHRKLIEQNKVLQDEVYDLSRRVRLYSNALEQANLNIENAKGYAWESYEDMGYALESLATVEP